MRFVVTLVSTPDTCAVIDACAAALPQVLAGHGLGHARLDGQIDLGICARDVYVDANDDDLSRLRSAVDAACVDKPVDAIAQLAHRRRKRLFLADMDSTMIGQECIDELADAVGLKAHVSAITERAMRGELPFEPALRERVALLKGIPVATIDRLIATRITLTPGARTLVATMRASGTYCALVSGGFTLFTGPVARMVGFDEQRANVLGVIDGLLDGTVAEPILGREAKRETLAQLRMQRSLEPWETLAVGDGANDLAMLEEAGLGVAYRAKPAVSAAAHARIEHTDLTTLLYAQGYAQAEFVSA